MFSLHGDVRLAFLVQYLNKPLVHLQPNLFTLARPVLHKGKIRSSQNVQVIVTTLSNPFNGWAISSSVAAMSDVGCQRVSITNQQAVCPHRQIRFPGCLSLRNLHKLVGLPLVGY